MFSWHDVTTQACGLYKALYAVTVMNMLLPALLAASMHVHECYYVAVLDKYSLTSQNSCRVCRLMPGTVRQCCTRMHGLHCDTSFGVLHCWPCNTLMDCAMQVGLATISAGVQRAGGSRAHPGSALDEALEVRAASIEGGASGEAIGMGTAPSPLLTALAP